MSDSSRIRRLSADVVNKIAAGEVIERPASIVKELMENSIDAGATRIDVAIGRGGCELVRVCDDGCGIAADELPLAVASHTTSKLRSADELFSVRTLGFRGEALASIASVSETTVRSRTRDSEAGAELRVSGGSVGQVAPCGVAPGTTIEVRNLFFNTPVRHKFLRSAQTELGHATEAFVRLALAHPHLHFSLRHNERLIHELPACDDWRERIARFFGHDLADGLLEVESSLEGIVLSGFAADPHHSRANSRMQYLFLNGRHIRDRSLQHALGEAYRGLLLTGRYPICFLRIAMPPEAVDVNVHPTKLEVRFQDASGLYRQLLAALRNRFLESDLTAPLRTGSPPENAVAGEATAPRGAGFSTAWLQGGQIREPRPAPFGQPATVAAGPVGATQGAPLDAAAATGAATRPREADWGDATMAPRGVQLHDRYLVAESDDGLVVIDQHALHERVLYEQMQQKMLAGPLESQRLLVPEPVDLAPAEAAAALEHRELLARLGLEVEPFGGGTLLVSSYPALLRRQPAADLLRDVAARLVEQGAAPERGELVDGLLQMLSCKAAVKAGDPLSDAEVAALLEQRHLARDAHHCPHGRPTALFFSRADLDRQFKRV